MMQYIMPFMTLFIGLSFPAGLALYWCVTTTFSAVQQYFISGWGSFWVGVPGMQHLGPEPKDTPALATASASRTVASARGLPAAAGVDGQPGGLRGMLKQIRDTMGDAQSAAARGGATRAGANASGSAGANNRPYSAARKPGSKNASSSRSRGGRPKGGR